MSRTTYILFSVFLLVDGESGNTLIVNESFFTVATNVFSMRLTESFETVTFRTTTAPTSRLYLNNPTFEDMENYIQTQKHVIDYLSQYKNELQRAAVEMQMKVCPYETLCNFEVDAGTDKESCCKPCHCENCESDDTCCPSVIGEENFIVEPLNSTYQLGENAGQKVSEEVATTCISQHLNFRSTFTQNGLMAISNCPRSTDSYLVYNCTRPYTNDSSLDSFLPVLSNRTLLTFRNKFCAFCNGVLNEDIIYFRPMFSCTDKAEITEPITSERDIIDIVFTVEGCDISFINVDLRAEIEECKYFISRCNVSGFWKQYDIHLDVACKAYRSEFRHENLVFGNVFCAMCNGITPHTVTCEEAFTLNADTFSFSGLLKLDHVQGFSTAKLEDEISTKDASSCTENQIFDALSNKCKDLFCPPMRMLQRGTCENIYESMIDYFSYILYIRVKPLQPLPLREAFGNESNWLLVLYDIFYSKFPYLSLCDIQLSSKVNKRFGYGISNVLPESMLLYIDARVHLGERSTEPWAVAENLLDLHGSTFTVLHDNHISTEYIIHVMEREGRFFNFIEELLGTSGEDIRTGSNADERINILSRYAMTDVDGLTVLPYSIKYPISLACDKVSKEIDVIRFSKCPKVNISSKDIHWKEGANGLSFEGFKIESNEYFYSDYIHIMICSKTFEKIVDHLRPQRTINAEIVMTLVSSSLSIFSLLITLVVFCLFSKLRTHLPGKNNMSLSASLMTAQVMLLIGSLGPFEQFSMSCKIVGMCIHFSWLYAVFWMNVCTYHMFHVLSKTKQIPSGNGLKRFVLYHIYVFIMSSVFVLSNVMSSLVIFDNIGYGGKFCYIISEKNVLITFVVPTMIVILANLSMFLVVVMKMKRSSKIRRNVQNDHNEIIIFAKLSTLTGLTWVFGFLYIWSNIKAFSYLFIILNAGQGVFIFLAFVVNRHVMLLFKEMKYGNKTLLPGRQKKSNSSNSTVSSKL